jgi:hypothetical protein
MAKQRINMPEEKWRPDNKFLSKIMTLITGGYYEYDVITGPGVLSFPLGYLHLLPLISATTWPVLNNTSHSLHLFPRM